MVLTQEEARKWAEILKGFSEGKNYQIPFSFNDKGEVTRYIPITDFEVNPQCPTISMTYPRGFNVIRPETIIEVKEIENEKEVPCDTRFAGFVKSL